MSMVVGSDDDKEIELTNTAQETLLENIDEIVAIILCCMYLYTIAESEWKSTCNFWSRG